MLSVRRHQPMTAASTNRASRLRIWWLLGGLLLVWMTTPLGLLLGAVISSGLFSGYASAAPVFVFVIVIFFVSFLPAFWVIRRYSSSSSVILRAGLAAAFVIVAYPITLFILLSFVSFTGPE